jgi:hypothetical protein
VQAGCCHLLEVGKFPTYPTSNTVGGIRHLCHSPTAYILSYVMLDICHSPMCVTITTVRISKVQLEIEAHQFNMIVDVRKHGTAEVNAVTED